MKKVNFGFIFAVIAALILIFSLPKKNIITITKSNYNYQMMQINGEPSKLIDPVINIIYISPLGPEASATGFSFHYDKIKNETYVLTNDHFCEIQELDLGYFTYENSFRPFGENYYEFESLKTRIKIISSNKDLDLCLMKTSGFIPTVKMAKESYIPERLDVLTTVGAPEGVFPVVNKSIFTGFVDRAILGQKPEYGRMFYFLSGMFYHGQSGSPVFNKKGEVIGVLFIAISSKSGGVMYGGFAIPITDIYSFLRSNDL